MTIALLLTSILKTTSVKIQASAKPYLFHCIYFREEQRLVNWMHNGSICPIRRKGETGVSPFQNLNYYYLWKLTST